MNFMHATPTGDASTPVTFHPVDPAHATPSIAAPTRPARECIQICRECQSVCMELASYSLKLQGYYSELGHIRVLYDCAKMCDTTVEFLLRGSEMRSNVAALCAEAARRCARDCARFDYDQRMLACAAVCERCAELCGVLAS